MRKSGRWRAARPQGSRRCWRTWPVQCNGASLVLIVCSTSAESARLLGKEEQRASDLAWSSFRSKAVSRFPYTSCTGSRVKGNREWHDQASLAQMLCGHTWPSRSRAGSQPWRTSDSSSGEEATPPLLLAWSSSRSLAAAAGIGGPRSRRAAALACGDRRTNQDVNWLFDCHERWCARLRPRFSCVT